MCTHILIKTILQVLHKQVVQVYHHFYLEMAHFHSTYGWWSHIRKPLFLLNRVTSNYRLGRARMVTEVAFGKLKGRWRVLCRKSENTFSTVKAKTLAWVVLHNICIRRGDVNLHRWDIQYDAKTTRRRPRELVRQLLHMTQCPPLRDTNRLAENVRSVLAKKFYQEKPFNWQIWHEIQWSQLEYT